MSEFYSGQVVKLKDDAIPDIGDQMAQDLRCLIGVTGIIHKCLKTPEYPVNWDWYFETNECGSIPVFESEIEAVQA